MRVLVWVVEGTWEAAVDAARGLPAEEITLLHVVPDAVAAAPRGFMEGLLGRSRGRDARTQVEALAGRAARELLDAAAERLGGDPVLCSETGRAEDVVLAAAGQADVLVVARDGPDGDPPPHERHHRPPPHERHPPLPHERHPPPPHERHPQPPHERHPPPPHERHAPPHERHPPPPHGPRRHGRGGPRSLGHATRFVVDHAPCAVLLVWPEP
jgi:nucleotide-binding universal stress UspA family protein